MEAKQLTCLITSLGCSEKSCARQSLIDTYRTHREQINMIHIACIMLRYANCQCTMHNVNITFIKDIEDDIYKFESQLTVKLIGKLMTAANRIKRFSLLYFLRDHIKHNWGRMTGNEFTRCIQTLSKVDLSIDNFKDAFKEMSIKMNTHNKNECIKIFKKHGISMPELDHPGESTIGETNDGSIETYYFDFGTRRDVVSYDDINQNTQPSDFRGRGQPLNSRVYAQSLNSRVYTQPSDSRVYTQPSNSRVYTQPSNSRVYAQPSDSRVYTQPSDSRVYAQPSDSRVYTQPSDSRVYAQPLNSRVYDQSSDSRVYDQSSDSRVYTRAHSQPSDSKVYAQPSDSRVYTQPSDLRVYTQSSDPRVYAKVHEQPLDPRVYAKVHEQQLDPRVYTQRPTPKMYDQTHSELQPYLLQGHQKLEPSTSQYPQSIYHSQFTPRLPQYHQPMSSSSHYSPVIMYNSDHTNDKLNRKHKMDDNSFNVDRTDKRIRHDPPIILTKNKHTHTSLTMRNPISVTTTYKSPEPFFLRSDQLSFNFKCNQVPFNKVNDGNSLLSIVKLPTDHPHTRIKREALTLMSNTYISAGTILGFISGRICRYRCTDSFNPEPFKNHHIHIDENIFAPLAHSISLDSYYTTGKFKLSKTGYNVVIVAVCDNSAPKSSSETNCTCRKAYVLKASRNISPYEEICYGIELKFTKVCNHYIDRLMIKNSPSMDRRINHCMEIISGSYNPSTTARAIFVLNQIIDAKLTQNFTLYSLISTIEFFERMRNRSEFESSPESLFTTVRDNTTFEVNFDISMDDNTQKEISDCQVENISDDDELKDQLRNDNLQNMSDEIQPNDLQTDEKLEVDKEIQPNDLQTDEKLEVDNEIQPNDLQTDEKLEIDIIYGAETKDLEINIEDLCSNNSQPIHISPENDSDDVDIS